MYSAVQYTGDGLTTDFAIPFPYIDQSHVEVSVDAESVGFTFVSSGVARVSPAPAVGLAVAIRRNSSRAERLVDYTDGANLTEAMLDLDSKQAFYLYQEAFDQESTQSYFSTDAQGARVINVADPIVDTDAATKGWVENYIVSLALGEGGGSDSDLLAADNVWTGTNDFNGSHVGIGGAIFDPSPVTTRAILGLNKGLSISVSSTFADQEGLALELLSQRSSGYELLSGMIATALATGSYAGTVTGGKFGAYRLKGTAGDSLGAFAGVVNTNDNDPTSRRVGLDLQFYNRSIGATQGGDSPGYSQVGNATGQNYYNANSIALRVWGQGRSDSNATYVGWNRGIAFVEDSLDTMKVPAWDSAFQYKGGDYAVYSGRVYFAKRANLNVIPSSSILDWADYGTGSTADAVGIDFAGVGPTTAARMRGAIRLRGDMPILYDTEGVTGTVYHPTDGIWALEYGLVEKFGINVTTKDIRVNGVPRVLGTQSHIVAAASSSFIIFSGWTQMAFPEVIDTRNEYTPGTGRFQPNTAGLYQIIAHACTEGTNSPGETTIGSRRGVAISKNGSFVSAFVGRVAGAYESSVTSTIVAMNGTTDYVTMSVYSDTSAGPGQPMSGEPTVNRFEATKIA